MDKIDINCYLGHWPYRKLYKNTFRDLIKIHKENGIAFGYVSSLNGIFYNDPFEGDEEVHEEIGGTVYRHILTVNPTLPGWAEDIIKALDSYKIYGVRVHPGIHGYPLDHPDFYDLCNFLVKHGLPLFLSLRMEDERLLYLLKTKTPSTAELTRFIETHADLSVIMITVRFGELMQLNKTINKSCGVRFDTSGFKDRLFELEKLTDVFPAEKILYGSAYPLYCLKSTMFTVEKAAVGQSVKDMVLYGNAVRLFDR